MLRQRVLLMGALLSVTGLVLVGAAAHQVFAAQPNFDQAIGGALFAGPGDCGKCEGHDCEDIECSPCNDGTTMHMCMGNPGNTADVTACYKASSGACTNGPSHPTTCTVDAWEGTGCSGGAAHPDTPMNGVDCY